jgi:hypothetical protein
LPPTLPFGGGFCVWLEGASRWPGETPVVPGEDMPLVPNMLPGELPGAYVPPPPVLPGPACSFAWLPVAGFDAPPLPAGPLLWARTASPTRQCPKREDRRAYLT